MKWFFLLLIGGMILYYLQTGSMGGASKATSNYQKVLLGDKYGK